MANDDTKDLFLREMQTMEIFLTTKAKRTALTIEEYINSRLLQGADPEVLKADLFKDLEEGGRIFGEFRSAIKATVGGGIGRVRDVSQFTFSENGLNLKYKWVAVLVNTCPDCMDRHGEVKSWDEWEAEGMPRTGQTVCKENCKCVLIPAELTADDQAPIKREAK
jgi:hypothetical protein